MKSILCKIESNSTIQQAYEIHLWKKVAYHEYVKRKPGDDYIPFEGTAPLNLAF